MLKTAFMQKKVNLIQQLADYFINTYFSIIFIHIYNRQQTYCK